MGSDEGESASDVGPGVVGSGVGVDDGAEEMARRKRIKNKRRSVSKFHFFVIGEAEKYPLELNFKPNELNVKLNG